MYIEKKYEKELYFKINISYPRDILTKWKGASFMSCTSIKMTNTWELKKKAWCRCLDILTGSVGIYNFIMIIIVTE